MEGEEEEDMEGEEEEEIEGEEEEEMEGRRRGAVREEGKEVKEERREGTRV